MPWHHAAAYFFGGVFLANSIPHLVAGVSGRYFPTPFASPPFRGPSSPPVNILWCLCNLGAAYGLLVAFGRLDLQRPTDAAVAAAGFGLAAVGIARSSGRLPRAGGG